MQLDINAFLSKSCDWVISCGGFFMNKVISIFEIISEYYFASTPHPPAGRKLGGGAGTDVHRLFICLSHI